MKKASTQKISAETTAAYVIGGLIVTALVIAAAIAIYNVLTGNFHNPSNL